MTRREMREHCFKILFGVEFYPAEEIKDQVEQYFDAPQEDDVADNGKEEVVHNVDMKEVDRTFLTDRVEGIAGKIPELDARIDEVAQGWKTGRMGKVDLTLIRLAVYEMKYDEDVPMSRLHLSTVCLQSWYEKKYLFCRSGKYIYPEHVCTGFYVAPDQYQGRSIELQIPLQRSYLFYPQGSDGDDRRSHVFQVPPRTSLSDEGGR